MSGINAGGKTDTALPVRLVEPLGKDTLLYFDAGTDRAFVAVSEGLDMADTKIGERLTLSLGRTAHAPVRRPRAQHQSLVNDHIHDEGSMDYREKSEIRDGMRIDWDMPIKMDDGLVLRWSAIGGILLQNDFERSATKF